VSHGEPISPIIFGSIFNQPFLHPDDTCLQHHHPLLTIDVCGWWEPIEFFSPNGYFIGYFLLNLRFVIWIWKLSAWWGKGLIYGLTTKKGTQYKSSEIQTARTPFKINISSMFKCKKYGQCQCGSFGILKNIDFWISYGALNLGRFILDPPFCGHPVILWTFE